MDPAGGSTAAAPADGSDAAPAGIVAAAERSRSALGHNFRRTRRMKDSTEGFSDVFDGGWEGEAKQE